MLKTTSFYTRCELYASARVRHHHLGILRQRCAAVNQDQSRLSAASAPLTELDLELLHHSHMMSCAREGERS